MIMLRLLHRVTVRSGSMQIEIKRTELESLVSGDRIPVENNSERLIEVTIPMDMRRRGVEAKLVVHATQGKTTTPDKNLISPVAQAHHWFDLLAGRGVGSIREIARHEGVDPSDIGHNLQFAFLAPDITEAIPSGRQPVQLTAHRLKRIGALPLEWDRQRSLLGFSA
ncbi:MAG: hypothetical protein O3C34_18390 [Proteobacteria bacterium]|nr:hypothetical protein [Pseudomonadota bacterium]